MKYNNCISFLLDTDYEETQMTEFQQNYVRVSYHFRLVGLSISDINLT